MDVYKIGVSIAMTNNVSSILHVIQRDVLGLHGKINALPESWGAAKVAAVGFGAALAGGAVLGTMAKLVEHGRELVHQQAMFKNQFRDMPGMTPEKLEYETLEATKQAYKTASEVLTSSVAENLKSIRELIGVFGDLEHAKSHLTQVVTAQSAMESLVGKGSGDQVFDMAKALEIKGVSNDPAHFEKLIDIMVKAANASGGKVTGSDFFQAFKYGRTATLGWSDEFAGQILPTLIQEMKSGHGSGGGVGGPGNALMSVFQRIVGGQISNVGAKELNRLGLVDPHKAVKTTTGDVKGFSPGGVYGSDLMQENPYEWVQKFLVPAMKAKGITADEKMREEIAHIFHDRTSQQIISMFATMQSRFEKDAALNRGAAGVESYKANQKDDPNSKIAAFGKAWENFLTALGAPLVEPATNLLMLLTEQLNKFTKWAAEHQTLIMWIEGITAGFAALAIALGVFAIGAAAISALAGVTTGIAALGAALAWPAGALSLLLLLPKGLSALSDMLEKITPDWLRTEKNIKRLGPNDVPGDAPVSGPPHGGNNRSSNSSGHGHVPPQPEKHSMNTGPVWVRVANADDIGRSVGGGLSLASVRPNAGPSWHDDRFDLPQPGMGNIG